MKKFFSKLPVMIVFVVLAVAVLGLYIGMLARPVSYGMTYSGAIPMDPASEETIDSEMKFINSRIVIVEATISDGTESMPMRMWYLRDGNKIITLGYVASDDSTSGYDMTEEDYNTAVEQYFSATEEEKTAMIEMLGGYAEINAFTMGDETASLTCTGAIVFAVIMGVVEVALIAFAVLSVVFFVLKKKSPQTEETQTEQQA